MTISTASFNERLSRIERERARTKGRVVLHVGAEEVLVRSVEEFAGVRAPAPHGTVSALAVALCVTLGMVSYAASVALRARFLSLPEAGQVLSDRAMLIGVGCGLVLAVALGLVLRLRGTGLWAAQLSGVVLAAMTLHNLAFWAPDQARLAFTSRWVESTQAATAPASLVFRETLFTF